MRAQQRSPAGFRNQQRPRARCSLARPGGSNRRTARFEHFLSYPAQQFRCKAFAPSLPIRRSQPLRSLRSGRQNGRSALGQIAQISKSRPTRLQPRNLETLAERYRKEVQLSVVRPLQISIFFAGISAVSNRPAVRRRRLNESKSDTIKER